MPLALLAVSRLTPLATRVYRQGASGCRAVCESATRRAFFLTSMNAAPSTSGTQLGGTLCRETWSVSLRPQHAQANAPARVREHRVQVHDQRRCGCEREYANVRHALHAALQPGQGLTQRGVTPGPTEAQPHASTAPPRIQRSSI